jgi:isocitrate/isopropylmalate dehydrogenase
VYKRQLFTFLLLENPKQGQKPISRKTKPQCDFLIISELDNGLYSKRNAENESLFRWEI